MRARIGFVFAAAVAMGGFAGVAHAERYVVLNGQRLSTAQIMYFERLRCGPIPNGTYWLNFSTGIWGYANSSRPMGHIYDNCRSPGRRPSLSERGLLFSPRDWVR